MFPVWVLIAALAQAGEPAASRVAPPAAVSAPTPARVRLAAGLPVVVELTSMVSSQTAHVGDRFQIRLAEGVTVDGVEWIAPGAMGEGEVIDVGRAGGGGRQAKLIVAARFLTINGSPIQIRGMTLMSAGKSGVDLATGMSLVPYVGLASFLVKGGEIALPAGTRATARLAQDLELTTPATPQNPGTNP